jgi:hypothetical protein
MEQMMDDDDLVRETYAHFGLAVYWGQVLEHGIVNAMVVLRLPPRSTFTRDDIDSFMDNQFKNTLGKLIRNLQAMTTIPAELEELLSRALKTRNRLCHDYFRERAVDFMNNDGRTKMIAELEGCRELLIAADQCLSATVKPIADSCGLTEEKMQIAYAEFCRENGISAEQSDPPKSPVGRDLES